MTPPPAASEDEFDALDDDYADLDLEAIPELAAPPSARSPSRSSEYSVESFDDAVLAEFDLLDARINALTSSQSVQRDPPCPIDDPGPSPRHCSSLAEDNEGDTPRPPSPSKVRRVERTSPPRKRPREHGEGSSGLEKSPRSRGSSVKVGGGESPATKRARVEEALESFEDEMSCPICCEVFACAHMMLPCGHSICGGCAWDWISKNVRSPTCPFCRTVLMEKMPLVLNFTANGTAHKFVEKLSESGVEGWEDGGTRLEEWNRRQENCKNIVHPKYTNLTMSQQPAFIDLTSNDLSSSQ